jgi:hypothetical protein
MTEVLGEGERDFKEVYVEQGFLKEAKRGDGEWRNRKGEVLMWFGKSSTERTGGKLHHHATDEAHLLWTADTLASFWRIRSEGLVNGDRVSNMMATRETAHDQNV